MEKLRMSFMKRLDTKNIQFQQEFKQLLAREEATNESVETTVREILKAVKNDGDKALLKYTAQFDGPITHLEIPTAQLELAWASIQPELQNSLQQAATRIRQFHEKQLQTSWQYQDKYGSTLGQRVTPLEKVGLYVPGGKAAYPSSVLMNAIPAKIAGVKELIMVSPTTNPVILAAAYIAKVDRVFKMGGAQAVGALAYGTQTIPKVDKIVGPGNAYVTAAKKEVFGTVGIDMLAGPSEVVIIADGSVDPVWAAYDLMAQAEHDEEAQSILLSPDESYLEKVNEQVEQLILKLERKNIIAASLKNKGALILVKDLAEAVELANQIAPEHLELLVKNPENLNITNAGAIFLGPYSAESLGDYCAGPNHVLPTSGNARFASPLSVTDFQKKTSIIQISEMGAKQLGPIAATLAVEEGLTAHALSAKCRLNQ